MKTILAAAALLAAATSGLVAMSGPVLADGASMHIWLARYSAYVPAHRDNNMTDITNAVRKMCENQPACTIPCDNDHHGDAEIGAG